MLTVFTCVDHEGFWPVGTCSMVVAENEDHARELLTAALTEHGINQNGKQFTLRKMNVTKPRAFILLDGDY